MARIRVPNRYVDQVNDYLAILKSGAPDPVMATNNSELVQIMFTDSDYISAFALGCLGAWAVGVMFGQVFKYISKLRT